MTAGGGFAGGRHFDLDHRAVDALHGGGGGFDGGFELGGDFRVMGGQLQRDAGGAIARRDIFHEAERHDVARVAGIVHAFEGVFDGLF